MSQINSHWTGWIRFNDFNVQGWKLPGPWAEISTRHNFALSAFNQKKGSTSKYQGVDTAFKSFKVARVTAVTLSMCKKSRGQRSAHGLQQTPSQKSQRVSTNSNSFARSYEAWLPISPCPWSTIVASLTLLNFWLFLIVEWDHGLSPCTYYESLDFGPSTLFPRTEKVPNLTTGKWWPMKSEWMNVLSSLPGALNDGQGNSQPCDSAGLLSLTTFVKW